MTYLVTGVAGFIASRVAELLLEAGHDVVGIDNLNNAYDVRLKKWRLQNLVKNKNFDFYEGDISDLTTLTPLFEKYTFAGVINLAARAGVRASIDTPQVYIDTNITGTLNLLELCHKKNIQKFVLASTSSLYGNHNPRPFEETADTNSPLSPYAATKKGAEALCATYSHLYNIDTIIVRYFTVYGPASRPDMSILRFIKHIYEEEPITVFGDGLQERDFTYVDDIARGTIQALNLTGHQIINLGNDQPVTLLTLIHTIEKQSGKKAKIINQPFHKADMPKTWANIQKAKTVLKWQPTIQLDEGIARSVAWYKANRDFAKTIDLGE